MIVLAIVIGVLMNLIVLYLFYRLEKRIKNNHSGYERAPFKRNLNNETSRYGQASIQFKEVKNYSITKKTVGAGFDKSNGRCDSSLNNDQVLEPVAPDYNHLVNQLFNVVPLYDYRMEAAEKRNVCKLYYKLGSN